MSKWKETDTKNGILTGTKLRLNLFNFFYSSMNAEPGKYGANSFG